MVDSHTWGLTAVERRSTTDHVLAQLRAAIVGGRIGAAEPLRETALASTFGTGRSAIREAIRHLVQEGLVEYRLNRGAFVRTLSVQDSDDVYLAREVIEGNAVQRALELDRPPDLTGLEAAFTRICAAAERSPAHEPAGEELIAADLDFHRELVRLARSPRLSRAHETLAAEAEMLLHHQPVYPLGDYAADHSVLLDGDAAARPGDSQARPRAPTSVGRADRRRDRTPVPAGPTRHPTQEEVPVSEQSRPDPLERPVTRRQVLHGAFAGGVVLGAGGLLTACGGSSSGGSSATATSSKASTGPLKSGGTLRVGATGGGAKDVIDAHLPTADTDIMRVWQLYEPLAVRPPDFGPLEMLLAESLEPEKGSAKTWIVKLRSGVEFHNGKAVTADDVIFSIQRILDPKNPKVGATSIGYVDAKNLKKIDNLTVRIPLKFANAAFPDDIGQYFNSIVPVGYDPKNPVGTGAFKYQSFTPGQQSVFVKNPNYWQKGRPYVDQLVIIDFPDSTARVNALLGGQVDAIDNLPSGQIAQVQGNSGAQGADLARPANGSRSRCASTRRRSTMSGCARRSG